MNGRKPNKADRKWMRLISEMGCVVCEQIGFEGTPAEIHHIEGSRKQGCHLKTIPLCVRHHRVKGEGWVSRHGDGLAAFEETNGTEQKLLEYCREALISEQA